MQPDSKVAPTHVNAYKADLAEKEAQYNALGSEIETLKETIATMEQSNEQPAEPVAEENEGTPVDETPAEDLSKLKRDELEEEAKDAGIENPDDRSEYPNKEVLAEATVEAQNENSDEGVDKPSQE